MSKQREALLLALDALDSDNPEIMLRASIAIREALAELEQEPVGIVRTVGGYPDDSMHTVAWLGKYKDLHDGDKLYAIPPARKPLTDEEVEDEWERITGHSIFGGDRSEGRSMYLSPDEVIEFARAIERAHGITE